VGEPESGVAIRPGVAAAVLDGRGRVLLHRRVVGGGWAPPSGAVEPGEDVVGALHREVREETGLTVRVERLAAVYSDPAFQVVRYPDGRTVHFVTCLFVCRRTGGRLRGSAAEGLAWGWFAPDALPDGLLPYATVWLGDVFAGTNGVVVR
jgi:8-oxo-dGTP diphosphatase